MAAPAPQRRPNDDIENIVEFVELYMDACTKKDARQISRAKKDLVVALQVFKSSIIDDVMDYIKK